MPKEASELARLRLMMQAQQLPDFKMAPVQDVGGGISQGANNIVQMMMMRRNQAMLQEQMDKEAAAAAAALAQKTTALTPVAQQLGMDVNTLMALPEPALTSLLGKQYDQQLAQQTETNKAASLHNSLRMPMEGNTLDEEGRIPMEQTRGIMNLPLTTDEQALDLVRTGGDKALTDAMATIQAYQLKNQGADMLAPDRSTVNGQKAYLNAFRALNGFDPTTDNSLQQAQATLRNTLLGGDNQAIQNHYLPMEKKLGLANSDADLSGKNQDQSWKEVLNPLAAMNTQANIEGTQAGTIGKKIGNETNANKLALQNRVIDIMSRDDMPIERRIAVVSALQDDPKAIAQTLKDLSGKEGILGMKPGVFKTAMDRISQETAKAETPTTTPTTTATKTPKPAAYGAGKAVRQVGKGVVTNLPLIGPTVQAAINVPKAAKQAQGFYQGAQNLIHNPVPALINTGLQFGNAVNGINQFGAGLFGGSLPAPPPQQPITLPGIRNAKASASAGANAAQQRINTNAALSQNLTQQANSAQALLDAVNAHEAERAARAKKILNY